MVVMVYEVCLPVFGVSNSFWIFADTGATGTNFTLSPLMTDIAIFESGLGIVESGCGCN